MSIEVWHGGKFVGNGKRRKYVGGTVYTIADIDIDRFGYLELRSMLKEVNLYKDYVMWLKVPGSDMELRKIKTDSDVIGMFAYMQNNVNGVLLIEHLKPGEGEPELLPSYCLEETEKEVGDKQQAHVDVGEKEVTDEIPNSKAPRNALLQECIDEFLREIEASEVECATVSRPKGRSARESRRAARAVARAAMFKKIAKQNVEVQEIESEEEKDMEYSPHETEVTDDSECDWKQSEACASTYELKPREGKLGEGMERGWG